MNVAQPGARKSWALHEDLPKIGIFLLAIAIQVILIVALHPFLGHDAGIVDLLPSLLVGWLFGPWRGALGAIIVDVVGGFSLYVIDGTSGLTMSSLALVDHTLVIASAIAAGFAGRQNLKLREEVLMRLQAEDELRQSREEAIRAERLSTIGLLVAGCAHEINNPLTFIRTNAELAVMDINDILESDPGSAHKGKLTAIRDNQARIVSGSIRIAHITKNLKRSANTNRPEAAPILVESIIDQALSVASPRLANVKVTKHVPVALEVLASEPEIVQVLLNLFLNAADAMSGKGTVEVSARADGPTVKILVKDTGIGIRDKDRPNIFRPFHTTKPDGTGLGLSISRRIAESHGGSLEFESVLGEGTTFVLTLPIPAT